LWLKKTLYSNSLLFVGAPKWGKELFFKEEKLSKKGSIGGLWRPLFLKLEPEEG